MKRLRLLSLALSFTFGCAKLPPPVAAEAPIAIDGHSTRLKSIRRHQYLHYAVGNRIAAAPETVWFVLTHGEEYTNWNSTIVSLKGDIEPGQQIELVSKVYPDRVFVLDVSIPEPGLKMTWVEGDESFQGIRTFTLVKNELGGTDWTMKEAFTGTLLKIVSRRLPDYRADFDTFAHDLQVEAERRAKRGG